MPFAHSRPPLLWRVVFLTPFLVPLALGVYFKSGGLKPPRVHTGSVLEDQELEPFRRVMATHDVVVVKGSLEAGTDGRRALGLFDPNSRMVYLGSEAAAANLLYRQAITHELGHALLDDVMRRMGLSPRARERIVALEATDETPRFDELRGIFESYQQAAGTRALGDRQFTACFGEYFAESCSRYSLREPLGEDASRWFGELETMPPATAQECPDCHEASVSSQ